MRWSEYEDGLEEIGVATIGEFREDGASGAGGADGGGGGADGGAAGGGGGGGACCGPKALRAACMAIAADAA